VPSEAYTGRVLLFRFGPEGLLAAGETPESLRELRVDPFATPVGRWSFGGEVAFEAEALWAPIAPGKIVGVGRSYREHALELGNEPPGEPILFLKSPSSVVGPLVPVALPPESRQVELEGEIAVVLRERLCRADPETARRAILGVTAACDVTARDIQRREPCFSRAKSFDTFCPLGPAVLCEPDLEALELITRLNGVERQRATVSEMTWSIVELVALASRAMTLEAGDVVLTGTPAGVAPLAAGDTIEVEIPGVGVLRNPVTRLGG
jgi:2-keto-4-pentenoate hydratase/2-oxohepta-3-ene-1,7-dioic acid hydratase in catechol pathway